MRGWKTLCISTTYSVPSGAEGRERSSTIIENSRVVLSVVFLNSNCLNKFECFSRSILVDWRQLLGFGQNRSVFANVLR